MSDYAELVDNFIKATESSLEAGLPRTANRILETPWLTATANEEQLSRIATLRARVEKDLSIEAQYGNGALIDLNHNFVKWRDAQGRLTPDLLLAMKRFEQAQSTI